MDFHLKQWRDQQQQHQKHQESESEDHHYPPSAKLPRLHLDPTPQQLLPPPFPPPASSGSPSAALPLFSPDSPPAKLTSTMHLSTYLPADSNSTTIPTKSPRMGSYFSLAQWQELELQALIYRHMLAGATIPPELLNLVRKSLLNSPPPFYFSHHLQPFSHYQPSLMQSEYWGKAAMDPEPGRCRRTDGKKWRCSRDVVAGQKYCERHMHRGRNRSRKPVESTTPSPTAIKGSCGGGGDGGSCCANGVGAVKTNHLPPGAAQPLASISGDASHFGLSDHSGSFDLLHLSQRKSDTADENKGALFHSPNEVSEESKSGGQILRHFFDDWPRSVHESDNQSRRTNSNMLNSATSLSISFPGDSSSDFSLKLSTGNNRDEAAAGRGGGGSGSHYEEGTGVIVEGGRPQLNWAAAWGTRQQVVSSMGGPLAEALRSSASKSSPTSVLHQQTLRGSISEASSYVSSTCI